MDAFKEVLDFCGLQRIPYTCYKFTWDNFRVEKENTKLVLDKAFLNSSGWLLCPNAIVKHLSNSVSDHLCLSLDLEGSLVSSTSNVR